MTAIIDKVRKLLRLAESPNANEAALAAAKAQELIDSHNLSAALLALDDASNAEPDEPIEDFKKKGAPLYTAGVRDTWRWRLASTVMRANACAGYVSNGAVQIVGRPADVDTVRYLFGYLEHETERLAKRDGRGCGRTWLNNYRLGVVDTIADKFAESRRRFEHEQRAQARGEGTQALVRIDTALARVDKRRDDVKAWIKSNLRLIASSKSSTNYNREARDAGRKAGQSIAINRARRSLGA
jgi:hypothetical protein